VATTWRIAASTAERTAGPASVLEDLATQHGRRSRSRSHQASDLGLGAPSINLSARSSSGHPATRLSRAGTDAASKSKGRRHREGGPRPPSEPGRDGAAPLQPWSTLSRSPLVCAHGACAVEARVLQARQERGAHAAPIRGVHRSGSRLPNSGHRGRRRLSCVTSYEESGHKRTIACATDDTLDRRITITRPPGATS
jgi:hypothetical protein